MLVAEGSEDVPIRYVVVDEDDRLSGSSASEVIATSVQQVFEPHSTSLDADQSGLGVVVAQPLNPPGLQYEPLFPLSCPPFENAFLTCQEPRSAKESAQQIVVNQTAEGELPIALKNLNGFIRCAICDRRFVGNDYYKHVKECLLDKPFKCDVCGDEYNVDNNLYVHHIIAHSEPNVVETLEHSGQACPLCSKVFGRTSAYYGHLNQHFVSETLSCSVCKDEFEYMAFLNHHMRTQHIGINEDCFDSSQICSRCGIIMPTKEDMEKHVLIHRKINKAMKRPKRKKSSVEILKPHKCSVCEKSFTKQYELTRHSVVHTKEKKFECEKCGKKFSQKSSMRQHMQSHFSDGEVRHKCELCDASFSQAGNLRRHVSLLHPVDVSSRTVFRCPHCTCVFNAIQPLQVHMGKRHPDDVNALTTSVMACNEEPTTSTSVQITKQGGKRRLLCCSICGKAFTKSCDLVRHYRIHSGDRPFACNRCNQKFPLKSSLNIHLETHARRDNPDDCFTSARCPICMKQLSTATSLRRHLKTHNRALEHCGICDQSFPSKKALETHQMACVRENVRMETCKSFLDLSTIAENEPEEQAEPPRPYRCTTCSASFVNLRCLKDHINRHTGIKPHFCRICAKSFYSLAQLKSHSGIHANSSRAFKCSLCSKTFKRRAQVKAHIRRLHSRDGKTSEVAEVFMEEPHDVSLLSDSFVCEPHLNGTELAVQLFNHPSGSDTGRLSSGEDSYSAIPILPANESHCVHCPVCLFSFYSDGALASHLLNMANDDAHKYAALSCQRCATAFTGSLALAEHMNSVHCTGNNAEGTAVAPHLSPVSARSQRKTHICDICGRGFTKPCDLTRHKRIHTGEKPFKCGVCERAFRVKSTLYQHMKTHESEHDAGRHLCAVCNRCYSSKSALKLHLQLAHAEERSFKCSEATCDQRFVTARQRDVHVRRIHVEHKGTSQVESVPQERQFCETLAQLTPSAKNTRILEQSQGSAFSRLDGQDACNEPTHVALKIRPHVANGSMEVQLDSFCGVIPEDESIVIELSVLRPLVAEGLLLKVPITTPSLSADSSIAVDARRVFKLLGNKRAELMIVPLNATTDVTDLPVAIFAGALTAEVPQRANTSFIPSCLICDETFETSEQSEAHFQSEDHETAQLFSLSNLANHLGSHDFNGDAAQYQSMNLRSAPTELCKLCSMAFESRDGLLAHIRREHERDNLEYMDRPNLHFRRRTLN